MLRSRWKTGRRFELARLIGDRVLAARADRPAETLFPATRTYSYRQRAQRAFAAELLSPFAAVDDMLADDLSEDRQTDASRHFGVSPTTIRIRLVNHGRLDREDAPEIGGSRLLEGSPSSPYAAEAVEPPSPRSNEAGATVAPEVLASRPSAPVALHASMRLHTDGMRCQAAGSAARHLPYHAARTVVNGFMYRHRCPLDEATRIEVVMVGAATSNHEAMNRSSTSDETVAALDDSLLAQLGGHSRFVRLSRQTAAKQRERHPDVTLGDYSRLQKVINQGAAILEKDRTLVFTAELDEGKWWRAVVKCTDDRRQTFLVTFHRIKPNQVAAAYRRGRLIRPGGR